MIILKRDKSDFYHCFLLWRKPPRAELLLQEAFYFTLMLEVYKKHTTGVLYLAVVDIIFGKV
jgi:hypothetical protein